MLVKNILTEKNRNFFPRNNDINDKNKTFIYSLWGRKKQPPPFACAQHNSSPRLCSQGCHKPSRAAGPKPAGPGCTTARPPLLQSGDGDAANTRGEMRAAFPLK